jgi:methyl-accepting chemotaxis protein
MINESIEESFIDEEKQTHISENRVKTYRDLFSFENFAEMYKKQRELVTVISQQKEANDRMQEQNDSVQDANNTMKQTIDRMQEKNDRMQEANDRVLTANTKMQQTIESMKKEMDRLKDMIETKDSLKHKAA